MDDRQIEMLQFLKDASPDNPNTEFENKFKVVGPGTSISLYCEGAIRISLAGLIDNKQDGYWLTEKGRKTLDELQNVAA
jgi:hypothetical protein